MKKRYQILIGLMILLIIIMVAAIMIMKATFTSEDLTAWIVPKLEASLNREVEIGSIGPTVFFWGVGVKVERVTIANREGFGPEPLIGLETLLVQVKLLPLLKRRLEVTKVLLIKPEINLTVDKNGRTNIDDFRGSDTTQAEKKSIVPLAISLPFLQIDDGLIRYTNSTSQISALLEHINQSISFEADRTLSRVKSSGKTMVERITLRAPTLSENPIAQSDVSIEYSALLNMTTKTAEIEEIKLQVPVLTMSMSGEITSFSTLPTFSLSLRSERILLDKVLGLLPPDMHPLLDKAGLSGWAQVEVDISGDTKHPRLKGAFTMRDAQIRYTDIPQPIEVRADITFTENTLDIPDLQAKVGENTATVKANIQDFKDPILNARVESNVNLAGMGALYPLPQGTALTGRISTALSAKGRVAAPEALHVEGQMNVAEGSISFPQFTRPLEQVQGTIRFDQHKVDISTLRLTCGQSDLKISGNVTDLRTLISGSGKKPYATFRLTSDLVDINEILPPAAEKTDAGQKKDSQPKQLPIPDIGADLHFTGKTLRWKMMNMNNVNLKIKIRDRIATVEELLANLYGGTIHTDGEIDLKNLETPKFSVNSKVNAVEANDFLAPFSSIGRHLFGKLTMVIQCQGAGADAKVIKQNLTGSGGLAVNEGRLTNWPLLQNLSSWMNLPSLKEMHFKDWQGSFYILDQRVRTDDLTINAEKAEWRLSGSTGFDGSLDYHVTARLSSSLSQQVSAGPLGKLAGFFKDEQERVNLAFRMSGVATHPKFEWDTASAREKAEQRLAAEAEKLRQQAEQKVAEEKAMLEGEAKKKAEELKRKAEEEKKKKEEELKKKAQKALKKLFNPNP